MQSILIVDDDSQNRYLLEVLFQGNGFEVRTAKNGAEALASARSSLPDLIVADILMPVMDGFTLCKEWRADSRLKVVPFIFYTATYTDKKNEELALSLGADHFVIKPQDPAVLMGIVRDVLAGVTHPAVAHEPEDGVLKEYNEVLFRKLEKKMADLERAKAETDESLRDLRQFIMKCPLPIAISNDQDVVELLNDRFVTVTGYSQEDIPDVETWWRLAYPNPQYRGEVRRTWSTAQEAAVANGCDTHPAEEFRVTCKDGTVRVMEIYGTTVMNRFLVVFNDLTERIQMEEHLRQSQKMESIGHLAGGIAHDFNNILTGIIGYGTLMGIRMAQDDPLRGNLNHMLAGAERAARLTQNLLAFSRKQVSNTRPVDLNEIVRNINEFIQRVISEDIILKLVLSQESLIVKADCGQIEQVLMNLATNARDAMSQGGILTMESAAVMVDPEILGPDSVGEPKEYARLSVTDNGMGMDEPTRAKIFEPFYTTKEVGKGTGLGMSIVYGIVKQHHGFINVRSGPGAGTTIAVYLPLIKAVPVELPKAEEDVPVAGTETILLADDDPAVRDIAELSLQIHGYTVITAVDGADAVAKFAAHRDRIALVLLDVIMPEANGRVVYEEIVRSCPEVKALFLSGYTADVIQGRGTLDCDSFAFIEKPFKPQTLLKKVRELLDG